MGMHDTTTLISEKINSETQPVEKKSRKERPVTETSSGYDYLMHVISLKYH